MNRSDIQPTRAGLQEVKRKIQIAEKGHRLLKLKTGCADPGTDKDSKSHPFSDTGQMEERYVHAQETMAIAQMMEGTLGLTIVAISVEDIPEILPGTGTSWECTSRFFLPAE